MKNPLTGLNKSFDHRVRLGVMAILMVSERESFTTLRDRLEVTDGRLASHLKVLEEEGYVNVAKQFLGRKPHTTYSATEKGKLAFRLHLQALQLLLEEVDPPE